MVVSVSVVFFFFFNDTATTEIYTLSLHDALPISGTRRRCTQCAPAPDSPRVGRSEEHTSELQSRGLISYAVFCLKKKKTDENTHLSLSLATSPAPPRPRHTT